ncbi:hypothetical protein [Gilvimarinus polysaccharolyticus]|uniref:hypothetical protein n=1 Tax=Gilvimarinus polysaccharolyticus TaxID=863921 RepID=UPI000673134B|nr:hypothetical protein [Gilvimarinus polysaccharolyticus]
MKPYLMLLLPALLTACSSAPERNVNTVEHFSTEITANGSKLFVYEVGFIRAEGQSSKGKRGGGRSPRGEGRKGGGKSPEGNRDRSNKVQEQATEMLEAKLAATGYCREGYMTLKEQPEKNRVTIHGECTETATDEDLSMFANPVKPESKLQIVPLR